MLEIRNLSKAFGGQVLLDNVTLTVAKGERIGLVGRNGHGKSTLLRIISGELEPDGGTLNTPRGYCVGYLTQHLKFTAKTVLAEAELGLKEHEDGLSQTYKAETILLGLGFDRETFERDPLKLSGGLQVRLHLVKLLLSQPQLLLLDEPTNYLDIVSLRWLAEFLKTWPDELMLVTHNQQFMDSVITHAVAIHRTKFKKIEGTSAKLYAQIQEEEALQERARVNQERQRRQTEDFIDRFRAKASKARSVQSRVKQLERVEQIEKLEDLPELDFAFRAKEFPGKRLLEAHNLSFHYPGGEELFKELSITVKRGDRIAIIGKNGKGKSTFLRVIAGELAPAAGGLSIAPQAHIGYFGQTNVDRLNSAWTIEEEILSVQPEHNRTLARGICGLMMFSGSAAEKKISVLSGGERSRVLIGKILVTPCNVLLLDEPDNHLDMHSSNALVQAINDFPEAVIIATHNEKLLFETAQRLIVFDGPAAFVHEGDYADFLDRVGWSDEQRTEKQKAGSRLSKKEIRQRRGALVAERSKVLGPLQKSVAATEAQIIALEEAVTQANAELLVAAQDGFGTSAAAISRDLAQKKREIERLFSLFEAQSAELEQQRTQFDDALKELDSSQN